MDKYSSQLWTIFPYRKKFIFLTKPLRARLYYRDYHEDLLNSQKGEEGIDHFLNECNQHQLSMSFKNPHVFILFYELGYYFVALKHLIGKDTPLAISLEYEEIEQISKLPEPRKKIELLEASSFPDNNYLDQFNKGYEHLLKGDCYQFNLTAQHIFNWKDKITAWEWVARIWRDKNNIGAYANATYLPNKEKLFFSNSPECLFQSSRRADKVYLSSMPIKGTVKLDKSKTLEQQWQELQHCEKNEAELLMITDLLRNDLSRIDRPQSFVENLKAPLLVPGLLHQYSKITTPLDLKVSLQRILSSLFPGGSITGAPKRRVMQIIKELEMAPRRFYCGSTVIGYRDFLAASINIRSASIDIQAYQLEYGAGGGITLQSNMVDERSEMLEKLNSFKMLL